MIKLLNIQKITLFAFLFLCTLSCTKDLEELSDVQVSFTATLPNDMQTRSFGEAKQVNTLVVGVFNEQQQEVYRKSFAINGLTADVQLSLAQKQTYNFIFWAYDNTYSNYNIDNLTSIKMNQIPEVVTYSQIEGMDAFYATLKDITITSNKSYSVKLTRPLAQINVGTTGIPMQASLTVKGVCDSFHPFTNSVSGSSDYTWNIEQTTTEKLSVEGVEYNYLAMGYLFAPVASNRIAAELTLSDGEKSKNVELTNIIIQANQRSNIVGNFTVE